MSALKSGSKDEPLQWQGYLDLLKDGIDFGRYVTPRQSEEALAQYFFMALSNAYVLLYRANPDYPEFVPYLNHFFNIAAPNPDFTYYFASIDGQHSYRIFGHRGTVANIDFVTGYDWFGFKERPGQSFPGAKITDFNIAKDGSFEILLSEEKPVSFPGNWMKLDRRATYVLVRQVGYKPDEVNGRLAIEKLGDRESVSRGTGFEEKFRQMVAFVRYSTEAYLGYLKKLADDAIINQFQTMKWSDVGGANNQFYQHGLYEVGLNEALIVSMRVPEQVSYWNIQTANRLWETTEFVHSQSNLNGHIDRSDSDGVTRFVLSHQDPGVDNWLDLNNEEAGYMIMRWVGCDEPPLAEVRRIAFADLASHVPADTRRVTPQERQQAIRRISADQQLRRHW